MIAIFKTGGKQYCVKTGQILKVEKIEGKKGENGTMPPKGFCNLCSEDEIKKSVLYSFHLAKKVQKSEKSDNSTEQE